MKEFKPAVFENQIIPLILSDKLGGCADITHLMEHEYSKNDALCNIFNMKARTCSDNEYALSHRHSRPRYLSVGSISEIDPEDIPAAEEVTMMRPRCHAREYGSECKMVDVSAT